MVGVLRALTWPHKYLVPVVSVAVLRERVGGTLLWFQGAQDPYKRGHLLTTPYWGEILKLPWEDKGALGRYRGQWYWELAA